ncbi:MAG: PilZ domain-containing protein [Pseudohongiellaceae bacterium]
MCLIRGGGLFISTQVQFKPGEKVFLIIRLLDEAFHMAVIGSVVWTTRKKETEFERMTLRSGQEDK